VLVELGGEVPGDVEARTLGGGHVSVFRVGSGPVA
jgi:hypothetical protein